MVGTAPCTICWPLDSATTRKFRSPARKSWTFMATTVGATIVYPGPDLSPAGLVRLFEAEQVTFSVGVPTVWYGIKEYLASHPESDLSSIETFLCGGSAVPRALIEWFARERDILEDPAKANQEIVIHDVAGARDRL